MAKKTAKKTGKNTKLAQGPACQKSYCCKMAWILAILIVVLVWISSAIWSKVLITIAAAILFLGALKHIQNPQER